MLGGGSARRDEGSMAIKNTNVFAALDSLKRKKKSDKAAKSAAAPEPQQVQWAPAPLNSKSWADVGDEDDDDFYATTAPPQPVWGSSAQNVAAEVRFSVLLSISKFQSFL